MLLMMKVEYCGHCFHATAAASRATTTTRKSCSGLVGLGFRGLGFRVQGLGFSLTMLIIFFTQIPLC